MVFFHHINTPIVSRHFIQLRLILPVTSLTISDPRSQSVRCNVGATPFCRGGGRRRRDDAALDRTDRWQFEFYATWRRISIHAHEPRTSATPKNNLSFFYARLFRFFFFYILCPSSIMPSFIIIIFLPYCTICLRINARIKYIKVYWYFLFFITI